MKIALFFSRGVSGAALALAAAPWLVTPVLLAQSPDRGSVQGTVLDPGGRPVAGARLQLSDTSTGHVSRLASGSDGLFQFASLAPGVYTLGGSAAGFADWRGSILVTVGTATPVKVRFVLASQQETVQVHEASPLIDTASVALSTTIDETAVRDLPSSSRRWSDFALLTAAATPDPDANGLLSFRGISSLLNNNTVDGADDNQAFFSEERGRTIVAYSTSQAAVKEFQVNTSNYGAQYGRAAGGVINTVTRSGTNQLHGELFFYDRNSAWGATNPFATTTTVSTGSVDTATTTPARLRNTIVQGGASVGGPIVRNRLFGIVTADVYRRNFPGIARATNPAKLFGTPTQQAVATLASRLNVLPATALAEYNGVLSDLSGLLGAVPRSASESVYFPKIDWQISDRAHATLQYNRLRWNSPNGVITSPSATYGTNSFGDSLIRSDVVVGRFAYFLSPNLMNELTGQYGRDAESETSGAPSAFEQSFANNVYGLPPQVRIESYGFRFGTSPVLNRAAYPDERRIEIANATTWIHDRHTVQFGYSFEFVNDYSNALYDGNGTYVYSNVMDFATDFLSPNHCDNSSTGAGTLPCYNYFEQSFGPTSFQFQSSDYAAYIADEWKVLPRLKLSLGVRYEYEQLPDVNAQLVNADIPQTSSMPHDKNNYGPRVGLAWDLTGSGHTVLRAGYGVYYGRIINATAFSALTNTGVAGAQRSYYFEPLSVGTPPFPYVFSSTPYLSVAPAAIYFDARFQNPQIHQAELSFEQRIGPDTTLTVSGLFSSGRELPNYVDTNIDLQSSSTLTYKVVDPLHQGPLPASYTVPFYTARLNPNYSQITDIFSETNSQYGAAVLRVEHRLGRSFNLHSSFTVAHATDWNQNATAFADTDDVLDPANFALEHGNSNADIRRRLTGGIVMKTPWRVHGWMGRAADGWELASTAEVRDGMPYSMETEGSIPATRYYDSVLRKESLSGLGESINGSGGAQRLYLVGRNTFRYPAVINANVRVSKRTQITRRVELELLGESFNLLNHQNVTSIDTTGYSISNSSTVDVGPTLTWQSGTTAGSSEFGSVLNGNNTNLYQDRQIQLSARLHF